MDTTADKLNIYTNEMDDIIDTIDMNEPPIEVNDSSYSRSLDMNEPNEPPPQLHSSVNHENENEVDENNTSSQHYLIDYLKDVDDDIEYIHIDKNLYGVLDLSVISINHKNVKHIYFGEGNITEIKNFPESLTKFECAKNLLSSLQDLPTGITEIDVSHNMITMIDLKNLTMLQKIRCSWNRLTCLNELPDSIIEIIVDNNSITEIDLSGLVNLEKVDCANNSGIVVKNVPTGVVLDIDMKGGGNKVDDENDDENNYDELLIKYFELKKTYEDARNAIKKANKAFNEKNPVDKHKYGIKVICVGKCGGNGGTIFKKDGDVYSAKCNNPKKCFEIEIDTKSKNIKNLEDSMNNAKNRVEKSKEDIIKQKMDTLFGYIQEKESSEAFLKKVKKYTEENLQYEEQVKEFNHIFHNTERDDSIQEGEEKINQNQEAMDVINSILLGTTDYEIRQVLINDLVLMQIETGKKSVELTKLKYELNCVKTERVDKNDNNNDKNPVEKSKCIQSVVKFENRFVVAEKDKPVVLINKFK
jgi:tetratricopeptide (TPR) repeat protein